MNAPSIPASRRLMPALGRAALERPAWTGILLLVSFFLLRSLVTFPVEHVDSLMKYSAAAAIVRTGDWSHLLDSYHAMRWSETAPQVLLTWASDFAYWGLYVLPLLAFAGYCTIALLAMRRHLGVLALAVLAGLLFVEPVALTHTGQLLNPPFGVFFAMAGAFVLSREKDPSPSTLVASAVLFFCAYGAHVTYLAFGGGAVLWLLWRRDWRAGARLALLIAALMLLEVLFYNQLSGGDLTWGRIEALRDSGHVQMVASGGFAPVEPIHLLTRWLALPAFDLVLVAGFLAMGIILAHARLTGRPHPDLPPFLGCALTVGGAYALAITFAVIDVNPVRPAMPLRIMYLEPFLPFAALASATLYGLLEKRLSLRANLTLAAAGAVLMGALFLVMVSGKGSLESVINSRLNAFFWHSGDLADYSERFARGELVIKGYNSRAMELLATYRNPVRVVYHDDPGGTGAAVLSPQRRCVAELRRYPLERNYQDCERFRLPPPPRFTRSPGFPIHNKVKDPT